MKIRKMLSIILSSVIVMGMCLNVHAYSEDNATEYIPVLDKESAQATFRTGNLSSTQARGSINSTMCNISNVALTENNVSVTLELGTDNKQVVLQGTLYDSYIQNEGYNAYVGDMADVSGEYEVLYFLIKDDTLEYKYILSEEYSDERAIVIYLQDENEDVYIIEQALPQITGGNLAELDAELAPSRMDYLWFTKILTPDAEGIISNDMIMPRVYINNATDTVYRDWTAGGDSFRETAYATVSGDLGDVPMAGEVLASTTLKFYETVYCNNSFYSNDSNYHLQAAGSQAARDMYGKIAVGYNTRIRSFWWDGSYYVWNGWKFEADTSIDVSLGGGYGALSAGASFSLSITNPSYAYNGGPYLKVVEPENGEYPKTAIALIEKSKNIVLEENGNYLQLAAFVGTIDNSLAQNENTSAKFGWTFDIFYYDQFTPAYSKTDFGPSVTYRSNFNQ